MPCHLSHSVKPNGVTREIDRIILRIRESGHKARHRASLKMGRPMLGRRSGYAEYSSIGSGNVDTLPRREPHGMSTEPFSTFNRS
jgi:hypothetical protein